MRLRHYKPSSQKRMDGNRQEAKPSSRSRRRKERRIAADITIKQDYIPFPASNFLWHLCVGYSKDFPDPKQPVRSELIAAFIPRVVRLLVLRDSAASILRGIEVLFQTALHASKETTTWAINLATDVLLQDLTKLSSEIAELDGWLHESGIDKMGCGNWLTDRGYSFGEAWNLIERASRHETGRRPAKRHITLAASEIRQLDGSRSWSSLANEFCPCGKSPHDDLCRETLRKAAAQLQSALKKYREIPIPADLIAPLSNKLIGDLKQLGKKQSI